MACCFPSTPIGPKTTLTSEGVVVGYVQDSASHAVPQAIVCATAVFDLSGVPTIVAFQSSTDAVGAYLVPIGLTIMVDVRASLTVAATPPAASGLTTAYKPGLTVHITTALPPPETTHVNIVVPEGPPYRGTLCIAGP